MEWFRGKPTFYFLKNSWIEKYFTFLFPLFNGCYESPPFEELNGSNFKSKIPSCLLTKHTWFAPLLLRSPVIPAWFHQSSADGYLLGASCLKTIQWMDDSGLTELSHSRFAANIGWAKLLSSVISVCYMEPWVLDARVSASTWILCSLCS